MGAGACAVLDCALSLPSSWQPQLLHQPHLLHQHHQHQQQQLLLRPLQQPFQQQQHQHQQPNNHSLCICVAAARLAKQLSLLCNTLQQQQQATLLEYSTLTHTPYKHLSAPSYSKDCQSTHTSTPSHHCVVFLHTEPCTILYNNMQRHLPPCCTTP